MEAAILVPRGMIRGDLTVPPSDQKSMFPIVLGFKNPKSTSQKTQDIDLWVLGCEKQT